MAKAGCATGKKRARYEAHKMDKKAAKAAKIQRIKAFKDSVNRNHATAKLAKKTQLALTTSAKCGPQKKKLGKRKRRAERMECLKRKEMKLMKLGHGVRLSKAASLVKKRGTPIVRGQRLHPRLQQVSLALISKRTPFITQESSHAHDWYNGEDVSYKSDDEDDEEKIRKVSEKDIFMLDHGEECFLDPIKAFLYVDECWPKARPLFPRRPRARAHVERWMIRFNDTVANPILKILVNLSVLNDNSPNHNLSSLLPDISSLNTALSNLQSELISTCASSATNTLGICRIRTKEQLRQRLTKFFLKHNPTKLTQGKGNLVEKACAKFENNQKGLNEILAKKYNADLDNMQGIANTLKESIKSVDPVKTKDSAESVKTNDSAESNVTQYFMNSNVPMAMDFYAYPYIARLGIIRSIITRHISKDNENETPGKKLLDDLLLNIGTIGLKSDATTPKTNKNPLAKWWGLMSTATEVRRFMEASNEIFQPSEIEALMKYHNLF